MVQDAVDCPMRRPCAFIWRNNSICSTWTTSKIWSGKLWMQCPTYTKRHLCKLFLSSSNIVHWSIVCNMFWYRQRWSEMVWNRQFKVRREAKKTQEQVCRIFEAVLRCMCSSVLKHFEAFPLVLFYHTVSSAVQLHRATWALGSNPRNIRWLAKQWPVAQHPAQIAQTPTSFEFDRPLTGLICQNVGDLLRKSEIMKLISGWWSGTFLFFHI